MDTPSVIFSILIWTIVDLDGALSFVKSDLGVGVPC